MNQPTENQPTFNNLQFRFGTYHMYYKWSTQQLVL